MSKNRFKLLLTFVSAISLIQSQMVLALDLQTKIRTTDKSSYNTISNPKIKKGKVNLFTEYNYSANPLVSKGVYSGQVNPLLTGISSIDIGANYSFLNNFQMGFLLPVESPAGAKKGSSSLGGALIEAKYSFGNFAIIPTYQMASKSQVTINNEGVSQTFIIGAPKTAMGIKGVAEFGDMKKNYGFAAQVGYVTSPDNKFANIDQSSKILMGIGAGMALSQNLSSSVELYGEKTPTNFPLEVLGVLHYAMNSLNLQVGMGTGNLQGSGSNTVKGFLGLNYSFGSSSSSSYNYPKNNSNYKYNKGKEIHLDYKEDGIDEQQSPDVLEPEKSKKPIVPELESAIHRNISRGIASEVVKAEVDPLAEIVNGPAKSVKLKKDNHNKDIAVKNLKENKKIVKNYSRMVTLPDGSKAKVFQNKVDELPSDIGVMYITESEYIEILKKEQLKNDEIKKLAKIEKQLKAKKEHEEKVIELKEKQEKIKIAKENAKKEMELKKLEDEKHKQEIAAEKLALKNKKIEEIESAKAIKEMKKMEKIAIKKAKKEQSILESKTPIKLVQEEIVSNKVKPELVMDTKVIEDSKKSTPIVIEETKNPDMEIKKETSSEVKEIAIEEIKAKESITPIKVEEVTPAAVSFNIEDKDPENLIAKEEESKTPVKLVEELKPLVYPTQNPKEQPVLSKTVDKVNNESKTPLSLEVVKTKEQLRKMLEEELSQPTEERLNDLKQKAKAENDKLQSEIEKQKSDKIAKDKKEADDKLAQELKDKEEKIKKEQDLTEGPQDKTPAKPATKKELQAVKLDGRNVKTKEISLPQAKMNAFVDGKPLDYESVNNENLNLLEDSDEIDEANGPSYGFEK